MLVQLRKDVCSGIEPDARLSLSPLVGLRSESLDAGYSGKFVRQINTRPCKLNKGFVT